MNNAADIKELERMLKRLEALAAQAETLGGSAHKTLARDARQMADKVRVELESLRPGRTRKLR